jgi:hypothetical protein
MRLNGCNAVWQFFKMRVRKLDCLWRVLQIRDTEQAVCSIITISPVAHITKSAIP